MNVKEIVREYLVKNGYDGLYDCNGCFCMNNDLLFGGDCSDCDGTCEPGYITGDSHIGPKK